MVALNIRKLPEEVHKALRQRATAHGRSMEAEIRAILEAAVRPDAPVRLGSMLAAIGQEFGGIDLNVTREPASGEPASFE